jgi:hypothetical protein
MAAPQPPVLVRRPWNTLELLKGALYLLWAVGVLFLAVAVSGVWEHRGSMKTIGKDTVPSIVAAQKIRASLAAMDSNVANELLGGSTTGAQLKAFEQGREDTANGIIQAAENITFGIKEREPVQRLQVNLGKYEEAVQRARDLHARRDPSAALAYLDSARIMEGELLPAADALDKANLDELEQAYEKAGYGSLASRTGIAVVGLVLILALLRVQVFLNRRMRRVLSPPLAGATLLAVLFLIYTLVSLRTESRELKIAAKDSFISIHALWQARSVAFAANAELSRDLLDDQQGDIHRRAFQTKLDQLGKSGSGKPLTEFASRANGDSGYLVEEMGNITFPGEQEAAKKTIAAFVDYARGARQVLEKRTGRRDENIARWNASQQAQVQAALAQLDAGIEQTLDINTQAFKQSVQRGNDALAGFEIKIGIFGLVFAALIYLGLLPRIREYS